MINQMSVKRMTDQKLVDKILDASRVDFSDRISRKPRTGYLARRLEWDMTGSEDKDRAIVQCYNRLMCEVTSLQQGGEDIPFNSSSSEEPTGSTKASTVSAVQLGRQVKQLHRQLLNLQHEKQLGVDGVEGIANPHLPSHKRLTAHIDTLKDVKDKTASNSSAAPPTGDTSVSEGASGSGFTYQLYYSPEVAKLNQLGPALQLEKRIDCLETLLGNDQEKRSRMWKWTREGSILSSITALSQRLSLLEPAQLNHIEGRLHAVHTNMNAIAEKAEASPDKQTKVQELHELMQKCDVLWSALPEVVERLVALQGLHSEVA